MEQVSLAKIKQVTVSDISDGTQKEKVLTVRKMPLGDMAEFFRELSKIPKTLGTVAKLLLGDSKKPVTKADFVEAAEERGEVITNDGEVSNDDIIDAVLSLPEILADNWDNLIKPLSLMSGVTIEDLIPLDFDEATVVIVAAIEVNNFFGIGDRYRELLGRKKLAQAAMTVPKKKR